MAQRGGAKQPAGGKGAKGVQGGAFDPKKFERPGLSADEIEEIKEAFDLFDSDNSGSISVAELTAAMKSLGFDTKNAVIYRMIEEMDQDGRPC
jgi:Ca2+-binding EF-hand superfamily protein